MSNFVLIPGMGCGAWAWQPVARRLAERGHRALPLTLPGMGFTDEPGAHGLDSAVQFVVDAVDAWAKGQPVVLVGHSLGGYPLTGAAARLGASRIEEVVYVNAVVPRRGVAMREEDDGLGAVVDTQLERGETVSASLHDVASQMMHDEEPALQQVVFDLMVPTPARYFTDALHTGTVTELGMSARYLLGTSDRALARPGEEFAARLSVRPFSIDGSHMSIFTKPESIAHHLCHAR